MKKVTLILAMFLGFVAFGQDKLARVENMSDLDVFVMNQPVAQYKIVVRMKPISLANLNLKTIVTGGIIRETASDKMNQYVNQVLRQADKEDVHVDAVIYSGGKGAVGIEYISEADQGIAKVKAIQGIDVYAFCTPLEKFDVVYSKRATSGFWVANATYGIIDSSIDRDIIKLVKRIKRKDRKFATSATMYNAGKKGEGITYK